MRRSLIHVLFLTSAAGCVEPICERDPSECKLTNNSYSIVRIRDDAQLYLRVSNIPPDASLRVLLDAGDPRRPKYLKYSHDSFSFEGQIENTPAAITALHEKLATEHRPEELLKTRFDLCVPLKSTLASSQISATVEPVSKSGSPLGQAVVFMVVPDDAQPLKLQSSGSATHTDDEIRKAGGLSLNADQLALLKHKKDGSDGEIHRYVPTMEDPTLDLKGRWEASLRPIGGPPILTDSSSKRTVVLSVKDRRPFFSDCKPSSLFASCTSRGEPPAPVSALALGPSGHELVVAESGRELRLSILPEKPETKSDALQWQAIPVPVAKIEAPLLLASGSSLLVVVNTVNKSTQVYRWLGQELRYSNEESDQLRKALQDLTKSQPLLGVAVGRLTDPGEDMIAVSYGPKISVLTNNCGEGAYIDVFSEDLTAEQGLDNSRTQAALVLAIGKYKEKLGLVAAGTSFPIRGAQDSKTYFQAWFP